MSEKQNVLYANHCKSLSLMLLTSFPFKKYFSVEGVSERSKDVHPMSISGPGGPINARINFYGIAIETFFNAGITTFSMIIF